MAKLGMIAIVFASATSFAMLDDTNAGTYKGGGVWKMADGSNGTYESTLTIAEGEGRNVQIKESLTINSPEGKYSETTAWTAVFAENKSGFFDINVGEKKIGGGYCFPEHKAVICSMTASHEEKKESSSETFMIRGHHIHRMGHVDFDKGRVAWKGAMHKEHNHPHPEPKPEPQPKPNP